MTSNEVNDNNNKEISENNINSEPILISPNNNETDSLSENIIQEIKSNEKYLITKDIESKIPVLLTYLKNKSNPISNKLIIIKYMRNLFTKVKFNSEIFKKASEKINIYKIIINQYIINKQEEEYLKELKDLFLLLLSQITLDKETYHYIFSFIIDYINKCNNNIAINDNNIFDSEQLSKILFLLQSYYQGIQTIDEPYNYFYFSGNSDTYIKIDLKHNDNFIKKFKNINEISFLFFIELLPRDIIKETNQEINYELININLKKKDDKGVKKEKNILISIDKDNFLITNFTSKNLVKLPENKMISIFVKLNIKEIKTDIFINNEKVEISKDILIQEKEKKSGEYKIRQIRLFKNFIGICSNIIIYKEFEKDKKIGLPKIFLSSSHKKDKYNIKPVFSNGIYTEELFNFFLKTEFKDKIDDKIYNQMKFPTNEKMKEEDIKEIKDFFDKYLISIYLPNRFVIDTNEDNKYIILKDSINDIDAELITDSPNLNGIHIFKKISEDFTPFGGLNHFLPIIEIMTQNKALLNNENLFEFISLLTTILMPSLNISLKNENNSNFFFNLSYFLEKIQDKYFDERLSNKLISISTSLIYYQNDFVNLIKQFHNDILLNEAIFFKFKIEDQRLILQQISYLLGMIKNEGFIIDIMLLINIILTYDEEKYIKFCCKFHSEYFNTESEIYSPELKDILKPVEDIISKLFEIFIREASQSKGKGKEKENDNENGKMLFKLFEMLTFDISPCLQKIIIKFFLNYMKNHYGKYYDLLDINKMMFDITLFIFKTSVFDVKIDALNLILFMNNMNKYMDESHNNRSRTNIRAFSQGAFKFIDEDKSIFIQNNIIPFYLLGEGYLLSKKNENKDKNKSIPKFNSETIEDEKQNTSIKINKVKKLKKNDFYKSGRTMTFTEKTLIEEFDIGQNSERLSYLKISSFQEKVYQNYKKVKLNMMILDLYNNTLSTFKESEHFDFVLNLLIKIVSKSDITLITQFLNLLKNKSEKKTFKENLYKNTIFFHWILETSFQIFMVIESNFDENKFKPGFTIDPIDENSSEKKKILSEEEKRIKIGEIFSITNEFIIDIIEKDIYQKLDFMFSWSKYYYELRNDKNNFHEIKNFIFKILRNLFNSCIMPSISDKESTYQNEYMYYLSSLFEYLTFYNFNAESKKSYDINLELSYNFPSILLMELMKEQNTNEQKNILLNMKWIDFPFYENIYLFFKPLWSSLCDKKKDSERDNMNILKKNIGKKNNFANELSILFNSYDNLKKSENANKGIKNIFLIFHFFILLFTIIEDKQEINNIYNDFYLFICLLIISSSSITIYENKKTKWPDETEYQTIQDIAELMICYTLNYYSNKILEIKRNIEVFKGKNDTEKINYFTWFHSILIESLGNIIKLLTLIYNNEYNENKSSFLSKLKSKGKTGVYVLLKNIFSFLETKDANSSKSLNNLEKEDNCINNILKLNTNDSEFEKNIYLFVENDSIQKFLSANLKDIKSQKKLYPFHKIIQLRHKFIKNLIPLYPVYNNNLSIDESQTNFCLVPAYWQKSKYNKSLEKKIGKINNEFIMEIILTKKSMNLQTSQKIKEYKRIKKKLFTFKGIWSKEEFFYDSNYHLKYKLVNHYTEDFNKILLTPIVDLDYYLPKYSEFETETLFRVPENQTPIYYLVDLSFALLNSKKIFNKNNNNIEENNTIQENNENKKENINQSIKKIKNALFDLKLINYNFSNESIETKPPTDSTLFNEYITKKHLNKPEKVDTKVEACLVKPELHICGIFYNNSQEIGFYGSDRTPENQEEYDFARQVCFGSIFKPQMNKYNYYYLKIAYSEIDFVLKRKYYYKKTGLEIFTTNKKSYFFRFDEANLKIIYENIKHYMKKDIEDICIEYTKFEEKIGFFNKNKSIRKQNFSKDIYIQIPNSRKNMSLKYLYEKWSKWEISTLNLISYLNFYSNRSFNDINQYPVFPWITLDYETDSFSKSTKIRPFGTPMGMLSFDTESSARKESFITTWQSNTDEEEDEKERYRSHFSTSLYITYYLVRVFPFANMRLELQGKNFDDPHRLFNGVKESFWCATTQRADLRELIPEFFFFPEMFYNLNKFELGEIKDKITLTYNKVNHIKMPKWANDDAYIFINKHRMLLESPEVNEKINEWFNLIFGVKQKGKEARKIKNLFLKYTYDEEFEEEYNRGDSNTRVYYCRMVEFGITPHQIFKSETNRRLCYNELKVKKDLFINMTEILKKNEEKNLEIINELVLKNEDKNNKFIPVKIYLNQKDEDDDKKKLLVYDNINGIIKTLKIEVQKKTVNTNNNIPEKNISKKILQLIDNKTDLKLFIPKNRLNILNNSKIPNAFYNKGHCIALGGFWNGSILIENIIEDKKEKIEKIETKIYYTKDKAILSHLLIDKNEIYLICGNNLGTIYIYIIDTDDKSFLHLYQILYDHFSPISSLAFDEKLNVFISCSKDGFCNLYSTPEFKLINSFKLKTILNSETNIYSNITLISSAPLPCIIFYFRERNSLCVCSINGHFIKEQKIDYEIRNKSHIKIFTDNQFNDYLLIFDQNNEAINIYNIIDLQVVMTGSIKNYNLIDFVLAKDFDNLFVLVKSKNEDNEEEKKEDKENTGYKILIMKNTKFPKINQEQEKKIIVPTGNEDEVKNE